MDPDILSKFQATPLLACPHAEQCPGCPLSASRYPDQLTAKTERVGLALARYPELSSVRVQACVGTEHPYAYRTRAKWVADGARVGLYARGTHQVLDLPGCRVVRPELAQVSALLRGQLLADQTLIEGADLASVEGALLVTLIASAEAPEARILAIAEQLCASAPEIAGVAFVRRQAGAVQLLTAGHHVVRGRSELRERLSPEGPYHYVAFGAFQQAHREMAQAIYTRLRRQVAGIAERPRVIELFAGSGSLALSLAAAGADVTAVESYAPACERAQRAAREQQLAVRVMQGDAESVLNGLVKAGEHFDVVLVNPPRRGLSPALRAQMAALAPKGIGYVSCRPETLARDLAHLARLGFAATEAVPFDMIPQTDQVETLVWLRPTTPTPALVLQQREGWVALNKAGHESLSCATVPGSIGSRAPLSTDVRSLFPLGAECSGVAVFVQASRSVEFSAPRFTFLALARGFTRRRAEFSRGVATGLAYERLRSVAGHSLLRVHAAPHCDVLRALKAIGHPVIGDARGDRASAKYFWLRHGLDRPFVHLAELTLEQAGVQYEVRADLAPDLASVLERLEAASAHPEAVEEDAGHRE